MLEATRVTIQMLIIMYNAESEFFRQHFDNMAMLLMLP